jgi:glycosyltransferase involved in cell wall biosynthesis
VRIGLLTTSFPRFEHDIAGCFVLGFARALAERGHRLEVLAPEPRQKIEPPAWPGVSVRWVPYLRPRRLARTFYGAGVPDNLQRSVFAWLGLLPFSLQLTRSVYRHGRGWDLLVSHWALPCALAAAGGNGSLPHVAVLHSADVHLLGRLPARSLLARHIADKSSRLLFVSPLLEKRFLGWLPAGMREATRARCRLFPMGIDPVPPADWSRERCRERLGFDRFTLVSLSRLVPVKGARELIRALAGRRDLLLVMAGDGPERPALQRLAARLQAPVRFPGMVIGERKKELLRAADAFVSASRILPSGRTEAMPTALLEALAHGLPAIATRVGAIGSYLEHESSALLVPAGDPAALRAAVDRLLNDAPLRRRLAGQGRALAERFTWPRLAPGLEELLLDVVRGQAERPAMIGVPDSPGAERGRGALQAPGSRPAAVLAQRRETPDRLSADRRLLLAGGRRA